MVQWYAYGVGWCLKLAHFNYSATVAKENAEGFWPGSLQFLKCFHCRHFMNLDICSVTKI